MAFLDETGVQNLTADIKALADEAYVAIGSPIEVITPSFSSLPQTFYSPYIKANHEMVENSAILSVPSAMGSDWEVTCSAGSLTINGIFSGSSATTVKMSLRVPTRTITLSTSG